MIPVVTVIVIEAIRITDPASPEGQWAGSISQTRNPPRRSNAASTSRVLRIGRAPSRRRKRTRYWPSAGGSVSGPAALLRPS